MMTLGNMRENGVRCSDALFRRHELRACPLGRSLDEVEDRLFRGAIVPRS
jgi:hypothetical protein